MSKVKISTDKGDMIAELYDNATPITVKNFTDLISKGFYNGINSVDEIKITNFVKDKVSVLHVDLYVNSDRENFDNIIASMEYELEKYIGNILIIVDNIIDTR